MTVEELIEELGHMRSSTAVKIEIGGDQKNAGGTFYHKNGHFVITDTLTNIISPISSGRRERIKEEIMDLQNDLDYLEGECSKASRKIEKILDLLEW